MKLVWIVSWALCLLGGIPGVAQAPTPAKPLTPVEQTLIATEKSLIEAKKKDDRAFFKRVVGEDFALVGVDGKLLERQEAVDDLGDAELVELTPYDMKVVMAGDAAGVVTYDAIVRKKPEEDQGPPPQLSAFQFAVGEAGGRVEAEVPSGDGGALGRLVRTWVSAFGPRGALRAFSS